EGLWQHATGDTSLIFNLCLQSAQQTDVLSMEYSSTGVGQSMPRAQSTPEGSSTLQSIDNNAVRDRAKAIFEGDLCNMQMSTLLQSISMSKMTGRLQVISEAKSAAVYFQEGVPVHAQSPENTGDAAMLELMIFEVGQFHFVADSTTNERTVKKRLDSLLMEGV